MDLKSILYKPQDNNNYKNYTNNKLAELILI